ncbi:hypothetical protein ACWEQC_06960 [Streptomyces shenzhenensis]
MSAPIYEDPRLGDFSEDDEADQQPAFKDIDLSALFGAYDATYDRD